MKFKTQIKNVDSASWWEDYEESEITSIKEALEFTSSLCSRFNQGLRPGEKARFATGKIRVLIGVARVRHNWEKTNLVTKSSRDGTYDEVKCSKCLRKARRVGLGRIVPEPKDKKPFNVEFCHDH